MQNFISNAGSYAGMAAGTGMACAVGATLYKDKTEGAGNGFLASAVVTAVVVTLARAYGPQDGRVFDRSIRWLGFGGAQFALLFLPCAVFLNPLKIPVGERVGKGALIAVNVLGIGGLGVFVGKYGVVPVSKVVGKALLFTGPALTVGTVVPYVFIMAVAGSAIKG